MSLSLLRDARTASSDSVSALMNLGLECGDEVVIRVKGRQADAALAAAMALLTTPEGHGPGQAEAATSSAAPSVDLPAGQLAGLVASAGIATGPLATLSVKLPEVPLEGLGRKLESPRLKEALERVGRQLEAARERAERSGAVAFNKNSVAHRVAGLYAQVERAF